MSIIKSLRCIRRWLCHLLGIGIVLLSAGCFDDVVFDIDKHTCAQCRPCEECVPAYRGKPTCVDRRDHSRVCGEDGNIHWLTACGVDQGVDWVCPSNSVCQETSSNGVDCVCTNKWQGPECKECPGNWDILQNCDACRNHWEGEDCTTCPGNWNADLDCSFCRNKWTGEDCTVCPGNWDPEQDCAVCSNAWVDANDDCGTCLGNWDVERDCGVCRNHWTGDNCDICPGNWDPNQDCAVCKNSWVDDGDDCGTCPGSRDDNCIWCRNHWTGDNCDICPGNWDETEDCNQCKDNWNESDGCTTCQGNWDVATECTSCLGNWDPNQDCTVCRNQWLDYNNDCMSCPANWDATQDCNQCADNWSEADDCTSCNENWDISTQCTTCLGNWDISEDCSVCRNNWTDDGDDCGTCPENWITEDDCVDYCGNGLIESGEECDYDSDLLPQDGCSNTCEITDIRVNSTDGFHSYPDVAIAPDGSFVVVWHSEQPDDIERDIRGRMYDANGIPIGSDFRINSYTTSTQSVPSIAMGSSGSFTVVWDSTDQDGDGRGIFGQRYDDSGVPVGSEFQINTYTEGEQSYPLIAMGADGSSIVVWGTQATPTRSEVFAQRYDEDGVPIDEPFKADDPSTSSHFYPSVDFITDIGFVVAWQGPADAGDIFAWIYDSDGVAVGSPFQVNTTTMDYQNYASVAMNPDGGFVVIWQFWVTTNSTRLPDLYGSRFASDGTRLGEEFLINTYQTNDQRDPSVDVAQDGSFVVVWQSYGQDGNGNGVFGRRFTSSGEKRGTEFRINKRTYGHQENPQVAVAPDGAFVVVWVDIQSDLSKSEIRFQRFNPEGEALGTLPW